MQNVTGFPFNLAEILDQNKYKKSNLSLHILQVEKEWDQSEVLLISQQGNSPQLSLHTVLKDQLDKEQ